MIFRKVIIDGMNEFSDIVVGQNWYQVSGVRHQVFFCLFYRWNGIESNGMEWSDDRQFY